MHTEIYNPRQYPKKHYLKTWSVFFDLVWRGLKTFELRENDRDFREGDIIVLLEYDPDEEKYLPREIKTIITNILPGGHFGLEENYCAISMGYGIERRHNPEYDRRNLIEQHKQEEDETDQI